MARPPREPVYLGPERCNVGNELPIDEPLINGLCRFCSAWILTLSRSRAEADSSAPQ